MKILHDIFEIVGKLIVLISVLFIAHKLISDMEQNASHMKHLDEQFLHIRALGDRNAGFIKENNKLLKELLKEKTNKE